MAPTNETDQQRAGRFIVIVGPDGAGKTTAAQAILDAFEGETGYFHFAPSSEGTLLSGPPTDPGPPPPKKDEDSGSTALSMVRLTRGMARFRLGWQRSVKPAVDRGALVIGDRWAYGYLVQPTPLRYFGPRAAAAQAISLLPQPDLVVNLAAPPEVIRSRKQELTVPEIERELVAWASLEVPDLLTVDATQTPEKIAADVHDHLWSRPEAIDGFRRFPPGIGHVLVPTSTAASAMTGMAMYGACRPRTLTAQAQAMRTVEKLGPRALPGRTTPWTPPCDKATWQSLTDTWQEAVGEIEEYAVHERRQGSRTGFAGLLLRDGKSIGFVKVVHDDHQAIASEVDALNALAPVTLQHFLAPKILATGQVGSWSHLLTTAFAGRHTPVDDPPIDQIADEISSALAALPKPPGTPDHWLPMHGDFTPWNLRRLVDDGRLTLTDWETATWAPPGADAALYRATAAAILDKPVTGRTSRETYDFWLAGDWGKIKAGDPDTEMRGRTRDALKALADD